MYDTTKIYLTIIYLSFVYSNDLLNQHVDVNKIIEYSTKIYADNCQDCRTTLIIHSDDYISNYVLSNLSTNLNMGLITLKINNYTFETERDYKEFTPELTMIFMTEKFDSIEDLLFALELKPFWSIRSKVFVLVDFKVDDEWIRGAFSYFWETQTIRVIIMVVDIKGYKVYGYNPFFDEFLTEITNEDELPKLFTRGVTNMNGYPLKFYFFDTVVKNEAVETIHNNKTTYLGFGGKYWSILAEALNASMMVHRLSEDFDDNMVKNADSNQPISKFFNIFKELFDFDAIMNSMKVYSDNPLDKVFLYERNDMFICVPTGEIVPYYLYIFLIVPIKVLISIMVCIVMVTIAMIIIRKISRLKIDFIKTLSDNVRLLLNTSVPFHTRDIKENFLYVLWMFHCLIFTTVFQSVLMTTLVIPKYYPNINSLQELYKTNITVYGSNYTVFQLLNELHGEDRQLMKHLVSVPKNLTAIGENLDWITGYRDSGVLISKAQVYELKRADKNTKRTSYHIIEESPIQIALAFCVRPDKFYYKEIVDVFGKVHDAGLNIYWRNYGYDLDIQNETYGTKLLEDISSEVLKLEHFQSAIMLLLFGNITSTIVFIFELCVYKLKSKK